MNDKKNGLKVLDTLDVSAALKSVGIQLLLLAEENLNATEGIDADSRYKLGDDLWLLSQVLGACLTAHEPKLSKLSIKLPETISAVTIPNPYYEGKSGDPKPNGSGSPADTGDLFPF
jgi:hypothetical protein